MSFYFEIIIIIIIDMWSPGIIKKMTIKASLKQDVYIIVKQHIIVSALNISYSLFQERLTSPISLLLI